MSKRAVLFTSVPLLALALLTGCTSDDDPKIEDGVAVDEASTLAAAGDRIEWQKLVEPCAEGELVVVQAVAQADMTGDGKPDAAVARACEGTDQYGASTVEVFDGASAAAQPKRLGTLLADVKPDKPYVDSVAFSEGALLIKANGVDEASNATCPEVVFTYRYKFSGGAFQQEKRETAPDETCGPE
ncbi:hypothetical protein OHA21_26340 [Actinoplanes sp. NBC_00393]|uniref:hypothetical protein n=1 Tax=Actinoplanes sp. NBC_00393 TaxID=2975953 RepID=UPI002E2337EF